MKNGTTLRLWLVVAGGIPWLFVHAEWANAVLIVYSMTAVLFGILLVGEFPPVKTVMFWKSAIPVVLLHSALVLGLVLLNLKVPSVNRLPRVVYGFLSIIVALEWRLALYVIRVCVRKKELLSGRR